MRTQQEVKRKQTKMADWMVPNKALNVLAVKNIRKTIYCLFSWPGRHVNQQRNYNASCCTRVGKILRCRYILVLIHTKIQTKQTSVY